MIPVQWYVILELIEIKNSKILGVTRMGERIIAWRNHKGEQLCHFDRFSHRGVALSSGKLIDDCIQFSLHGYKFDSTSRISFLLCNRFL